MLQPFIDKIKNSVWWKKLKCGQLQKHVFQLMFMSLTMYC